MPLRRALLLLVVTSLLAGIIPAGIVIDRHRAREIESRARADLAQAPAVMTDRNRAQAEALVMHAKEIARAPGLAEATAQRRRADAVRIAEDARAGFGDQTVLLTAQGQAWLGPAPATGMLEPVSRGQSLLTVVWDSGSLHSVALAPLVYRGNWTGSAGVSIALDLPAAGALAALTRSDVIVLGAGGALTTSTASDTIARFIAAQAAGWTADSAVREVVARSRRYLVVTSRIGDVATILFVRDLTRDLAVVPQLRGVLVATGTVALLLGLFLGSVVAVRIAAPVSALADAADRLAAGDVGAPLMGSAIGEIDRLSEAFDAMRRALAARLEDVLKANRELADRQARLERAQAELLQRERITVSSRLVAELSHEIRNPIANVRNCLEIVRRRVGDDPQGREFTDLAIQELLRMHELAEQMLDLNRPRDPEVRRCHAATVARRVAQLATAGHDGDDVTVTAQDDGTALLAAIAPDALKQVLLNLVQNAREAIAQRVRDGQHLSGQIVISSRGESGRVVVDVIDNGTGIPDDVLPHVFDPFYTTKGAVQGIGLGLFVVNGLVSAAGGRVTASNMDRAGTRVRIEVPIAAADFASETLGFTELTPVADPA